LFVFLRVIGLIDKIQNGGEATCHISFPPTPYHPWIAMRWSRASQHKEVSSAQRRPSSSSSSDTPRDDQTPKSPQVHDPGLARLFSDAALYRRILTSSPDLRENEFVTEDSQTADDSLNGFSRLVACHLDDNERVVSEKLAQLSVSNWASSQAHNLAPDVGLDEIDETFSDDEHHAAPPSSTIKEAGDPDFVDHLKPSEILDLLQQEFGALAEPGEEKLLLETDATLFQDVVILVWRLPATHSCNVRVLTTNLGGGASYDTSPHVPRVASVLPTQLSSGGLEVRSNSCAPQRVAP
jgi:sterol 3beta-glucosyltransferase